MNIEEIYLLCKENYERIEKISLDLVSGDTYQIRDFVVAKKILRQLDVTNYLGDSLQDFSEMLDKIGGGEINVTDPYVNKFRDKKKHLLVVMDYIIKTYELTNIHEESEIGLDIKLPLRTDFSEFRKDIDDLDFILTKCPFFHTDTETLQLKSVQHGSVLFTLIVTGVGVATGSVLLNNIAAFIDKCFIIKSHQLTIQKQKQEIERSETEQKEKEKIFEYIDRIYKIEVENALKTLEEELNYAIQDGDERGRAEQSIEKLNKLIDKGIQIYSTIGSPEETKALFEPLEMKFLTLRKEFEQLKIEKGKIEKKD